MCHQLHLLPHVCGAQDDASRRVVLCGKTLDGNGGVLRVLGQCRRRNLEASRCRECDVRRQVLGLDGEGLRGICTVDGEFVSRCFQCCEQGCVCSRSIEVEVFHVCPDVLESHLCCGYALDTGQLHVVSLQRTAAVAPCCTCQVEPHANLLRVGTCLEVCGIGLVFLAGDLQRHLVVVVLQVLNANGRQLLSVLAEAALGQSGECVCLVGRNVHNLRDLSVSPSAFPVVSVDAHHVVVLVHLVGTLFRLDVLVRVVLVDGVYVPSLNLHRRASTVAVVALTLEVSVLDEILLDFTVCLAPFGLECEVGNAEGVDRHSVAIYEDSAVTRNGISVGVVLSVGIVESTAVGRVGNALLRYEHVLGVLHAHGRALDVSLEA